MSTHAQAAKITKKTMVVRQCGKHRARVARTQNDVIDIQDKEEHMSGSGKYKEWLPEAAVWKPWRVNAIEHCCVGLRSVQEQKVGVK